MCDALHVVVPVTVVHICDKTAAGQRQVIGILLDGAVIGEALDEDHLRSVGREAEALDIGLGVGHLPAVRAVSLHRPDLSVSEEGDACAIVDPCGIGLTLVISRQKCRLLSGLGGLDVQDGVALVELHGVVAHLIDHLLTVGRGGCRADAAHGPKCLGCHQIAGELNVVLSYHIACVRCHAA